MALFFYQAFNKAGKKTSGTLDAPSQGSAREMLQQQGFYPIQIIPAHKAASTQSLFERLFSGSVSLKDKIMFTKQLAILLKSGIPLLQSLEILSDQFSGKMNRMIVSIKDGLKEGQSFADGLRAYPAVFENIYVQLVRSGEASGHLEVILDRLTQYLERRAELQGKVSSALRTPMIQITIIFIIVILLMTFVVPTLSSTFAAQGAALPLPTQILMAISNFLTNYYLVAIALIVGGVTAFSYWSATSAGALKLDKIKLKIPVISFFARTDAIVQFSRTLGMLLEGGVNLSEALDIVCSIVDNRVLRESLQEARDKIIKQGKIAQYLKQTGIFPPMATYLIGSGEESGKLDEMLLMVGTNYEKELEEYSDNLTVLLSPFITIFTALVVGFIVLSIALPMVSMSDMVG